MQWLLFVGVLVGLNVAALFISMRSGMFERKQLVVQQILVWLLPLFGAIVVLVFTLSQGSHRRTSSDQIVAEWENADVHHSHSSDH